MQDMSNEWIDMRGRSARMAAGSQTSEWEGMTDD
jgi:hypothetical protein